MNPRILIVDDDEDLVEALTDALTGAGHEVTVARDGLEALERLRLGPLPAFILLDWRMPRCGGSEFRARQLADPAIAGVPIVPFTADHHVRPEEFGADVKEILHKPVSLEVLLGIAARLCG